MNKTSDFIKLIDGVEQLQKYVRTNVINIPVPKEAKEMFDDINNRLDTDIKTLADLSNIKKTSPEQMVEIMSGIHFNLIKTNKVIKETFGFINMIAGDASPTKESFCDCDNWDCYDWDCWGNLAARTWREAEAAANALAAEAQRIAEAAAAEARRVAEEVAAEATRVANAIAAEAERVAMEVAAEAERLANLALKQQREDFLALFGCELNFGDLGGTATCVTNRVSGAVTSAIDAAKFDVKLSDTKTCNFRLTDPFDGVKCVGEAGVQAVITPITGIVDKIKTGVQLALNEAEKLKNDAVNTAKEAGKLAENAAKTAATESAKGVFKGLGLNNSKCRLDENNILSGGADNSLVKYADCMKDVAVNEANRVANSIKDAAVKTVNDAKDFAEKTAKEAYALAEKTAKDAAELAEKTARDAQELAVKTTIDGIKGIFDGLGLNAPPCVLDTNNIFTAGSGNALLKYAECRGEQALDALPQPTILGCKVNARKLGDAVSCIGDSAKTAVMGPINSIADSFTSAFNVMLAKFKDLLNIIEGFGETIWQFFQDVIDTIKSQATAFVEKIELEGGKILEKIKNEAGKIVTYVTDEGDRIVKYVLDQAGNIIRIITTEGNLVLTKIKDQAGNIITFITTESGKIIKTVTDTGGQMVAYVEDTTGELIKIATSTAENVISSVKDEAGKIIKFVETSGGSIIKIVTDETGKVIRTVEDAGTDVVNTVSEKAIEFTDDASKFGQDVIDIVLEQGKNVYETIGKIGQSVSDSVTSIVDRIKEYTVIAGEIWGKIKEVGGMILKALWKGIVAVGRTIKWIITNGPGWVMSFMRFLRKNLLIIRNNMPILIMMTVMIVGFVQTASYIAIGTSQIVPLPYLFLGAFGATMVIANFFEGAMRYLNQKIIDNTIKQFVMTIAAVTVLKVVVVDFLLSSALPRFVQDNILLSSVVACMILLGSAGYLLYSNYNKVEEPVEPGIIDDIKGYIQGIIDTAEDIVDV